TARLLAHDPKAQDRPVKGFRSLEVIDVDGGFDDGLSSQVRPPQSSSTSTSFPWTWTGKLRTPVRAGGANTSPVLTLNCAPCQGQVTTSPANSPSPNGPPRWVQVLSMAWKVPATLNRAMLRPSASTTLPVPGASPFVSVTFTSLDMVFAPFRVMRCPTISQQLLKDGFVAGFEWRRPAR